MSYRAMSGTGLGFSFDGGAEGGFTLGPDGIQASGSASGGSNVEEEVKTQEEKSPPVWSFYKAPIRHIPLNVNQDRQDGGGLPWWWIGLGVAGLIVVGGVVYVVRRKD